MKTDAVDMQLRMRNTSFYTGVMQENNTGRKKGTMSEKLTAAETLSGSLVNSWVRWKKSGFSEKPGRIQKTT
jgi:hypothetical protein